MFTWPAWLERLAERFFGIPRWARYGAAGALLMAAAMALL